MNSDLLDNEVTNLDAWQKKHDEDIAKAERLMNSDKPLSPEMVSSLLHIDVLLYSGDVSPDSTSASKIQGNQDGYYMVSVIITSIVVSIILGGVLLYMSDPALVESFIKK